MKKKKPRRFKPVIRHQRGLRAHAATVLVALSAAIGVIQFYRPDTALGRSPFGGMTMNYNLGAASGNAFGKSGEVKLLFTMPGERVEFPLAVGGDPTSLRYEWTSLRGSETGFVSQPLDGAEISTPLLPGFYYLTLVNGEDRQIIREPALAVMRPFQEKLGTMLNGYRIGTYLAERFRGTQEKDHPDGFLEIYPQHLDLAITKHLRLRHFLTHDDQQVVWPKYVALSPRLLDKLELVLAELSRERGDSARIAISVSVHSGFRTPSYNLINRFADDSRHQYGDAADVAIDANGDGRYSVADSRLVALAVETVERDHPELVGGMGLYAGPKYHTPYVHIDARGHRARWRG